MKLAIAVVAAAACALYALPVLAQMGPPDYEDGPVWVYQNIQTKDGMQDRYIHWLDTEWKAQEESLKHHGVILDYKVLEVFDPRTGEPDILLGQEFPNMASFDTPPEQVYAGAQKFYGSPEAMARARQGEIDRNAMRTVMGTTVVREIRLK
ncbi:MAG: hypothetical protein ACRED8_12575 [Caulobacteraceae bacterium]